MQIDSPRNLNVYKRAYALAMEIFELSKDFPGEERFALTSEIRRSSRSICPNLREAWAKRRYEAHFVSKLTDCDGENGETESSLDFARDCGYIAPNKYAERTSVAAEIGKMLKGMIEKASSFSVSNVRPGNPEL
jgi:four helix bundle protein